GLGSGDIALITTSRLVLKNGVGDVIKALPKLPKNIKFVILGEGYLEKELKELAIKLNVSNRIIFKGFVEHPVLNKYLKASDIFIRTSRSEGQGISFLEAMACKLPVIATPVGGIVDFLHDPFFEDDTDNQTGYFCQPENPESIAEAVKRVMGDLQKNSVVENAYNMVKEKYDWDLIAREMNEVFDINRAPKDVSHDMISLNQIK
ncbi:MAG: Glycosyltransferase, partial [Parcubacteria group bacterium GW2011_GWB1_35_5]